MLSILFKDSRALRPLLIVWLILHGLGAVARSLAVKIPFFRAGMEPWSPPEGLMRFLEHKYTWTAEVLIIGCLGWIILQRLWQSDPWRKETAFWRHLPVARWQVFGAKIAFVIVWMIVPPMIITAVYAWSLGFGLGKEGFDFVFYGVAKWWLPWLIFSLIGSLTQSFARSLAVSVILICAILTVFLVSQDNRLPATENVSQSMNLIERMEFFQDRDEKSHFFD